MNCRFCNIEVNKNIGFSYGKIPMTPNALEKNILMKNGKFYEYDFDITICKCCGLIQQFNSPNPSILYFRFKNEVVGKIWERHYQKFSKFILNNAQNNSRLLEIGAGDLKLANILLQNGVDHITIVEKNIVSKNLNPKLRFHKGFLEDFNTNEKFDIIYSSHVLEHIDNINGHLKKISNVLKDRGKLIFSVPHFKKWIENFNLNAFSQEHTIYPLFENIEILLKNFCFKLNRYYEFENHSLFIEADFYKNQKKHSFMKNKKVFNKNLELLKKFSNNLTKFNSFLSEKIKNKRIYIFGANSATQILLKKFLKNVNIIAILDNANIKENKYLYGFEYIVKKPYILENVSDPHNVLVLIFTGAYTDEIKEQVVNINSKVKTLTMNDFKESIRKLFSI